MKQKLKILDSTFSHSILGYCSDFQTSEYFEWDRSICDIESNLVITDNFLTSTLPPSKNKIAWLIEPICIAPNHYNYIENNLSKFDYILTHEKSFLDLSPNMKFVPFGCCWIAKEDQNIYTKTKNISIISSNKSYTDGHKLRHEVIQKFNSEINVFGRGYSPVEFKIQGLKDYRYSIVIENCKRDYWFSEKLIDCFMTGTIPIYWGCPSIGDFFDTDGMIIFDKLEDLENIINSCNDELYNSKITGILENFHRGKNYLLPDDYIYNFVTNLE